MQSTTYGADSEVISTTVGTNNVTVSYSRKYGRENYGGEEVFISAQIPVGPEDTQEEIDTQVRAQLAYAKTVAYTELGLDSTVSDTGIVRDVVQAAAPKSAKGGASKAKAAPAGDVDKDAAWQDTIDNPSNWFNNIETKTNPKGPDFKGKNNGPFADVALWLSNKDTPGFAKLAYNVEV